jgi:sugar phosphate isomerase/epimerase
MILPAMDFIKDASVLKTNLNIIVLATNWGYLGTMDQFCKKVKDLGYDGIEVWWPGTKEAQKELFDGLEKYQLQVGFLVSGNGSIYDVHADSFKKNLDAASDAMSRPLYINCHSGKDFYSFDQNRKLIEYSLDRSALKDINILHETHRGRMCFAANITRQFLEKYPDMALTLDISHWTNVHESMLEDQAENIEIALQRTKHIHARVGHEEGPQVNDPRAPEWAYTFKKHLEWWDKVLKYREAAGDKRMTFLTEFGPPNYLPALPYTQAPVADQWSVNTYMLNFLKARYQ